MYIYVEVSSCLYPWPVLGTCALSARPLHLFFASVSVSVCSRSSLPSCSALWVHLANSIKMPLRLSFNLSRPGLLNPSWSADSTGFYTISSVINLWKFCHAHRRTGHGHWRPASTPRPTPAVADSDSKFCLFRLLPSSSSNSKNSNLQPATFEFQNELRTALRKRFCHADKLIGSVSRFHYHRKQLPPSWMCLHISASSMQFRSGSDSSDTLPFPVDTWGVTMSNSSHIEAVICQQ